MIFLGAVWIRRSDVLNVKIAIFFGICFLIILSIVYQCCYTSQNWVVSTWIEDFWLLVLCWWRLFCIRMTISSGFLVIVVSFDDVTLPRKSAKKVMYVLLLSFIYTKHSNSLHCWTCSSINRAWIKKMHKHSIMSYLETIRYPRIKCAVNLRLGDSDSVFQCLYIKVH